MKKTSIILLLAIIANQSFSQEMKTLFKKDTTAKTDSYGGYGAPIVGMGMIDNTPGFLIGGKGGLIKNHHFSFGGIGMAIISSTEITYTTTPTHVGDTDSVGDYNMSMGYGGIYLEYIFNFDSPIHISLPLNICVGGLLAGGDRTSSNIKSSGLFIIEPGINFEFNFSQHFVPALNIGYRFASADNAISSAAASGLNVSLVFKFGRF